MNDSIKQHSSREVSELFLQAMKIIVFYNLNITDAFLTGNVFDRFFFQFANKDYYTTEFKSDCVSSHAIILFNQIMYSQVKF